MADTVTNELLFEHLKRIQGRLDNIEREIVGLKSAVISSHEVMAAFMKNDTRREGEIFALEQRMAKIERRLELYQDDAE
ncbi:MAG: hypothetical protein JO166_20795 [Deltaproteobacteria bacterium]|nr:hypothetical protein [Deltaproteobacteria bacterium]